MSVLKEIGPDHSELIDMVKSNSSLNDFEKFALFLQFVHCELLVSLCTNRKISKNLLMKHLKL